VTAKQAKALSKADGTRALVAHACNPSYLGGRDKGDCGSKPAQANSSRDPSWKTLHKNRAGGVAQGVGPEFKPQYPPPTHTQKANGRVALYFCTPGRWVPHFITFPMSSVLCYSITCLCRAPILSLALPWSVQYRLRATDLLPRRNLKTGTQHTVSTTDFQKQVWQFQGGKRRVLFLWFLWVMTVSRHYNEISTSDIYFDHLFQEIQHGCL
jgi:hypothetical protein